MSSGTGGNFALIVKTDLFEEFFYLDGAINKSFVVSRLRIVLCGLSI